MRPMMVLVIEVPGCHDRLHKKHVSCPASYHFAEIQLQDIPRGQHGAPNSNIRRITRREGPNRGLASLRRPLRPLPASCSWEEAATRRPKHQPQRSQRQSASVVSSPPHYSTLRDVGYRHLSRGQQTEGRAADASCQVAAAVWRSPGCRGFNSRAMHIQLGAAVVRLRAPNHHALSLERAQKFSSWPFLLDEWQGSH